MNKYILPLIVTFLCAFSYGPFSQIKDEFVDVNNGYAHYGQNAYSYSFDLFKEQGKYVPDWGQNLDISKKSDFILAKAATLQQPIRDCNVAKSVDLLFINEASLSKMAIDYGMMRRGDTIYGLYDSMPEGPDTAKMFLVSSMDEKQANKTTVHELTHYWFARMCWKGDEELFAQLIASYYTGEIKDE